MDEKDDIARLLFSEAERFWHEEGGISRPTRSYEIATAIEHLYWLSLAQRILQNYTLQRK